MHTRGVSVGGISSGVGSLGGGEKDSHPVSSTNLTEVQEDDTMYTGGVGIRASIVARSRRGTVDPEYDEDQDDQQDVKGKQQRSSSSSASPLSHSSPTSPTGQKSNQKQQNNNNNTNWEQMNASLGRSPAANSGSSSSQRNRKGTGDSSARNRKKKACCFGFLTRSACQRLFLTFFILCILLGSIGLGVAPQLIQSTVRSMTSLSSPLSRVYKYWLDPNAHGVSTHRSFYLYNITNPLEIASHGEVPNIVVRGPFVYREIWKKDPKSIRWYLNGTIGYHYEYRMFFESELSIDAVSGEKLREDEVVTVVNGPLRGTAYRVGRLPDLVVRDPIPGLLNITRQDVCMLLFLLINQTVLGPKGVFTQRSVKEILWGYIDPIWNELHKPLASFNYNASTFFQAQWNGSMVSPSPYTFRSGMMCPLWQSPAQCNNTGADVTLQVSGAEQDEIRLLESDKELIAKEQSWASQIPTWLKRGGSSNGNDDDSDSDDDGSLLLSPRNVGDTTTYAGQLQGQWWWGPSRPGMTGGDELYPVSPLISPPSSFSTPIPYSLSLDGNKDNDKEEEKGNKNNKFKSSSSFSSLFSASTTSSSPSPSPPPPVPEGVCHRQYGSDGTRFPSPVTKSSTLHIFNDMMGRTFPFTFSSSNSNNNNDKDQEVEGISTLRFLMNSEDGLSNSTINRYCFQQRFDGLINVSQYVFGDGIVTKAMFLDTCFTKNPNMKCVDELMSSSSSSESAGKETINGVPPAAEDDDGFTGRELPLNLTFSLSYKDSNKNGRLSFDEYLIKTIGGDRHSEVFKETHETFADVVGLTGTTLSAHARGQISLVLGPLFARGCPNANISRLMHTFNGSVIPAINFTGPEFRNLTNFTKNFPRTVIPYLRLDRSAKMGGSVLKELKFALALVTIGYVLLGVALGLGLLGVISMVFYFKFWRQGPSFWLSDNDDDDDDDDNTFGYHQHYSASGRGRNKEQEYNNDNNNNNYHNNQPRGSNTSFDIVSEPALHS